MNRRIISIIVLLLVFYLGKSVALWSEEFDLHHTGVFSNLSRDSETGDISGIEIFIMHSNNGYYLTYQCAAGEIATPVLVPARISKSNIEFTIPDEFKFFCNFGKFRGTIDKNGIKGRFMNSEEYIFLERKKSFWQR